MSINLYNHNRSENEKLQINLWCWLSFRFNCRESLAICFKTSGKAPDLVFKTTSNQSFSFNEMSGKPVLITFWASSCGVCMADLPKLTAIHNKYASKGLQMFSVAMPYDKQAKVLSIAKTLPFPVVLDPNAVINNAFGRVMFTPTNFLIAPNGDIALKEIGPFNADKVESTINTML